MPKMTAYDSLQCSIRSLNFLISVVVKQYVNVKSGYSYVFWINHDILISSFPSQHHLCIHEEKISNRYILRAKDYYFHLHVLFLCGLHIGRFYKKS